MKCFKFLLAALSLTPDVLFAAPGHDAFNTYTLIPSTSIVAGVTSAAVDVRQSDNVDFQTLTTGALVSGVIHFDCTLDNPNSVTSPQWSTITAKDITVSGASGGATFLTLTEFNQTGCCFMRVREVATTTGPGTLVTTVHGKSIGGK